jgi:Cu/Ag efflux protein CusF
MSSQERENAMKIATIISVGATALFVLSSGALAQQARTGTITEINRLTNTIAIRQGQNGTVGANTGGAAEEFKIGSGISLEGLHAGDRVSFTASGSDGTKTITKVDRQ